MNLVLAWFAALGFERTQRAFLGTTSCFMLPAWPVLNPPAPIRRTTGAANTGARNFYGALGFDEEDVLLSRAL